MLSYFSIGGCPLNNPLLSLVRRNLASPLHVQMGFRRTPFSLSSGGARQLVDFCLGRVDIPRWVRGMCYGDPNHVPSAAQGARLRNADVVFIEMSTPIEFIFDDFVLNQNRFKDTVLLPLQRYGDPVRRLAARWVNEGLQKQNTDVRVASASALLELIPDDSEQNGFIRQTISRTHARHVKEAEIYQGLKYVAETLDKPTAVILHNYSYMPDGRPLSWPPSFKEHSRTAAERLGIPVYDPATVVNRHWGKNVMMADLRHYSRGFDATVGDEYLRLAQVIQPSLLLGKAFDRLLAA